MSLEKFQAKLTTGSFMFCGKLALKRGEEQTVVVADQDDSVLRIFGLAVFKGSVVSDKSPLDILGAIRNDQKKKDALRAIGATVDEPVASQDVYEALEAHATEVEVVYETENPVNQDEEVASGLEAEAEESEGTDKDILDRIIRSQTAQATKAIKSAKLTKEDREYLIQKEREGRGRTQIIALLGKGSSEDSEVVNQEVSE